MIRLSSIVGNWETLAFVVINKILFNNNPYFERSELFNAEYMNFFINVTEMLGHKQRAKHPEETLQRTIQNMRDKGFIEFLGDGRYKLKEIGYIEMERLAKRVTYNKLEEVVEEVKKAVD